MLQFREGFPRTVKALCCYIPVGYEKTNVLFKRGGKNKKGFQMERNEFEDKSSVARNVA